jgi:bidirectional [NiFe] hydrogenase diaphorase subunit
VKSAATSKQPAGAAAHPSGDRRFKVLEVAMKRHQFRQDALIEVLHTAQSCSGTSKSTCSTSSPGAEAAAQPGLRRRHVLSLLHPQAEGAAHLRRLHRDRLLREGGRRAAGGRGKEAGIGAGRNNPGRRLSLLTARCLGACGIAPAVVLDGTVLGHQTPDDLLHQMKGWLDRGPE